MASVAKANRSDTAVRILDLAEHLVQVHGYNGFSYADIATALQVTKASLHYHFPSKAELGRSLMARYTEAFGKALAKIDLETRRPIKKLESYIAIYANVLAGDRMCLCGMLAAEFATLPTLVQAEVLRFFDFNETWLAAVLSEGRRDDQLAFEGRTIDVARSIMASLEGAMMLARTYGDVERFKHTSRRLLAEMRPRSG